MYFIRFGAVNHRSHSRYQVSSFFGGIDPLYNFFCSCSLRVLKKICLRFIFYTLDHLCGISKGSIVRI